MEFSGYILAAQPYAILNYTLVELNNSTYRILQAAASIEDTIVPALKNLTVTQLDLLV